MMSSSELLQKMGELSILPGTKLGPSHSVEESVAQEIITRVSAAQTASKGVTVVKRRKKSSQSYPDAAETDQESDDGADAAQRAMEPGPESAPGDSPPGHAPEPRADAPSAEASPRPARIAAGPYDKATIIGTQEINATPDNRGNQRTPSAAADKNELPDFMKLSPTQTAQVLPPDGVLAATAQGADAAAQIPPVAQPAPPAEATPPQAGQPAGAAQEAAGPRPGQGAELDAGAKPQEDGRGGYARRGDSPTHRTVEIAAADGATDADAQPKRRPDRSGPRITRELTLNRSQHEPAKVIGVATGWHDKNRQGAAPAGGPGKAPGERVNRFQATPRAPQGLRPLPSPRPGPAGAGARPAQQPQAADNAPSRKRNFRKKKGGFTERTIDDIKSAKRRDFLVERTDLYSEGTWERTRTRKPKSAKKNLSKTEITVPKAIKRRIKVDEVITVSELAHRLSLKVGDIIKKLMALGVMAGINQSLDFDTATLVAAEFGYDVEKSSFDEGDYLPLPDVDEKYPLVPRPPVVTIMGHVDHGKTSLLDYIRETKIQEGEAGGITQHIGAYHVMVGQRYITFLDTPGHEAFTAMRSRGAQVTDIVILIVAADDGVMPQTREAADHAKAAKVPIIVAVNKIDKPGADPERIRRQMMELGLTQEAWGGDTVFVDISAKTGQGVDELLEMILLQADLLELKARQEGPAKGRIIEARLDKGRGAMATVLVGEGTLRQGDTYVCGVFYGKIRAMFGDDGRKLENAGPAVPVEIQGISGIPLAGDEFIVMEDEKQAKQVSQHRLLKQRESVLVKTSKLTLENLFDHIKAGAVKGLNLIIKADVQGSLEAILDQVGKFSTPEIKITVIHTAIGVVTETDIMLASASNALIICFGVKPPAIKVQEMAEAEEVQIRYYDVIYKLLEDIKEAMAGLLDPIKNVKIIGQVDVRAIFHITKIGQVAGCYVTDGKVTRGARAKLIRDKEVVYDGRVASLKREKNDVREVMSGYECGLSLEGHGDVREGDRIEIYQIEETAATVDLINEHMKEAATQAANKANAAQAEAAK
jgi:translation initiation factor IF-2